MAYVSDSVDNGVSHIDVGGSHINLCTEHSCTVGELTVCHSLEKVEVFFDASVSVGTVLAGLCESTAVFSDFISCEVADISLAHFDELDSAVIDEIEVA